MFSWFFTAPMLLVILIASPHALYFALYMSFFTMESQGRLTVHFVWNFVLSISSAYKFHDTMSKFLCFPKKAKEHIQSNLKLHGNENMLSKIAVKNNRSQSDCQIVILHLKINPLNAMYYHPVCSMFTMFLKQLSENKQFLSKFWRPLYDQQTPSSLRQWFRIIAWKQNN